MFCNAEREKNKVPWLENKQLLIHMETIKVKSALEHNTIGWWEEKILEASS
jgi:hypothetical protein